MSRISSSNFFTMVKLQLEVGFFGTSPKTGNEERTLPNRKAITEMRGLVVRVDIWGYTDVVAW